MKGTRLCRFLFTVLCLLAAFLLQSQTASAQMRQIYVDNDDKNEIRKLDFYSAKEGFVAFEDWIGYTTDSGRTYSKKEITLSNVDYNGYSVSLTFGFDIKGVKGFDANNLLVYGNYGFVPAILRSADGGNTFKLIFQSRLSPTEFNDGVIGMVFPQDNTTGYAIDVDRILKTTDGGNNWSVIYTDASGYFSRLEAVDNNNAIVFSLQLQNLKLLKTLNGGGSWQTLPMPVTQSHNNRRINYAHFLTPNIGWLDIEVYDNGYHFYKTTNGGYSWIQQNNADAASFYCNKMKFIDENTGYAITGEGVVYKTTNSGLVWEPLPREDNKTEYSFSELQCLSASQLWAGGAHGALELSTNGGGTPLPKAYFAADTTDLDDSVTVTLTNYSKTGYTYQWFVNEELISTSYNASYTHNYNSTTDNVKLIVSDGVHTNTSEKTLYFHPPVIVSSFTPTAAAKGDVVTITGVNFYDIINVYFGGVPASRVYMAGANTINAVVDNGASGSVMVLTKSGRGSLAGFTFIPAPIINSFTPTSAITGTPVVITGANFNGATSVSFGGTISSSFTVLSSTSIKAIAPSSASGDIIVSTPGGKDTLAGFIALPTIASFTPNKGTQGTLLHITGTSLSDVTNITVGGVAVSSFTAESANRITAVVGAGASGSVVVSKPGGTASLPGFTWYPPPVITTFSPMSGPAGTIVTIAGTGFDPTASKNLVHFGATKAQIISGSATSLTVKVPAGATYDAIRITSNNLVGYSSQFFLLTFANGGSITAKSFATASIVPIKENERAYQLELDDFDNDGKTDLGILQWNSLVHEYGFSVYRNVSTQTDASFETPVRVDTLTFEGVGIADLDGDGKTDVVGSRRNYSGWDYFIVTYRNTSVPGSVSFTPDTILTTNQWPYYYHMADFDGDGKTDFLITTWTGGSFIYRNVSEPGAIAFAEPISLQDISGRDIQAKDMDGDGKPDLILSAGEVRLNTSTKGNISFAEATPINGYLFSFITTGDIDGDGKPDLIASQGEGNKISIVRNLSTTGKLSFAAAVQFDATQGPVGIKVADMDGDGKPDVATALVDYSVAVYKNISIPGNIVLAPKEVYFKGNFGSSHQLALGDLNGDGRTDAVAISESDSSIIVHTNTVQPEPFIQSFTPTMVEKGATITITGNNFTNISSVTFGGVAAASFTVTSPTTITAVVAAGGKTGDVVVTNNYGVGIRAGFVFGFAPVITSVSPSIGAVGSSITIQGKYFGSSVADNTVYFGDVKATVLSASATLLQVTVPAAATHRPITVTVNERTAYSPGLFGITFPNAATAFTATSFAKRVDRTDIGYGTLSDMDGDGRLDLIYSNYYGGVTIDRNSSSPGVISFDRSVNFSPTEKNLGCVTGDIDGDGKPDVIAYNFTNSSFSVLRNTSSGPGQVSLGLPVSLLTGAGDSQPNGAVVSDVDGDGKPDVIISNHTHTVSVFRNESVDSSIRFGERIDYYVNYYAGGVTARDINGDGKPELIVVTGSTSGISVFENYCKPGVISFSNNPVKYNSTDQPNTAAVSDMDGDGKLDIISIDSGYFSLLRNQSTTTGISFTAIRGQAIAAGTSPNSLSITDFDGDGKPDIVTYNWYSPDTKFVSVYKNRSTPGTFVLDKAVNYDVGDSPYNGSAGDIDGDGKADIVTYSSGGIASILRNMNSTTTVTTIQICAGSDTTLTTDLTGTQYQWQENSGNGFADVANGDSLSGTNTAQLKLIHIAASHNHYQYRCVVDGAASRSATELTIPVSPVPSVTIKSSATTICAGTQVVFTARPTNGGAVPSYQWMVNDVKAGSDSISFTTNSLADKSNVKVIMTSNAVCPLPATGTSNIIDITVNPILVPSVSVSTYTTNVCADYTNTFLALPVNGTLYPDYQWKVNGAFVGVNDFYFSNSLQKGDIVTVTMTSKEACASPASVVSTPIVMTANPIVAGISIKGNTTITEGGLVSVTAQITNGGFAPGLRWQDSTSLHGWQDIANAKDSFLTYQPVLTGDKIRCLVTSHEACVTVASATSNELLYTIKPSDEKIVIHHYPNPVTDVMVIDELKISDAWESLTITNSYGATMLLKQDISGQTSLTISLATLPKGMYIGTMRGREGKPVSFRFIKM